MNQVFLRSEQLADKIYDTKLYINEWKVLFALDGKMDHTQIAEFLELSSEEVQKALSRLKAMGLILPQREVIFPAEKPELEEKKPIEPDKDIGKGKAKILEEELTEFPEEVVEGQTEKPLDTASLLDEIVEEAETPEVEKEPPAPEETPEALPFEFPSPEVKMPQEEVGEEFEELKLEEEVAEPETEGEQDLDNLINDLLKEESAGKEGAKGPQILDESEMVEWESDKELLKETPPPAETEIPELKIEEDFEAEQPEAPPADMIFEAPVAEMMEEEKITRPTSPQKTILVVDDSIVIRKMVEIALENENYNVVSVATGKEAFNFLDSKDPDLVILDIMLPDVNGLDILKVIKTKKNIPVVMLSAKDTPKETAKAKELGANDFIPKPFRDEELVNKIHELIGQ